MGTVVGEGAADGVGEVAGGGGEAVEDVGEGGAGFLSGEVGDKEGF